MRRDNIAGAGTLVENVVPRHRKAVRVRRLADRQVRDEPRTVYKIADITIVVDDTAGDELRRREDDLLRVDAARVRAIARQRDHVDAALRRDEGRDEPTRRR